jgi:hypothetical protein
MEYDTKTLAAIAITNIGNFLLEFEGMTTQPNVVTMQGAYYSSLKKHYPYMVKEDKLMYNGKEFKIILVQEDFIGLSFCLFFEDLQKGTECELTP